MCAICNFKIEFGVGHPLALTVAVATRKAIEAGLIQQPDALDGTLSAARMRLSSIDALNLMQHRIEGAHTAEELLDLPDFYVLLIENDTWGFFHATGNGFDPDIVPEMPDITTTDEARRSNVIVTSEAGLRAWLNGHLDTEKMLNESMLVVDAPNLGGMMLTKMLTSVGSAVMEIR